MKSLFPYLMLLLTTAAFGQNKELDSLLGVVDEYRGLRVSYTNGMKISTFKNKKLDNTKEFNVLISPEEDRKVLIRYLSPAYERNNLVLFANNKMWVYNTKSSRPVPISFSQRLLGDASVGDVVNIEWRGNYDGDIIVEDSIPYRIVDLKATNRKAVYKRLKLFLDKKTNKPIKCELLTHSRKLLKTVYYRKFINHGDKELLSEVVITDDIKKDKVTQISFNNFKEGVINPQYFNKNYLPEIKF